MLQAPVFEFAKAGTTICLQDELRGFRFQRTMSNQKDIEAVPKKLNQYDLKNDKTVEERMQEIFVRQARFGDVEAILQVLTNAFMGLCGRGYARKAIEAAIISPEEVQRRISQGAYVMVAESEGLIIGTATGLVEHETLHVCSVAVDPTWQDRGVGQTLMESLEAIARMQRHRKLWLQTSWVMAEAISLYKRMGYRQEGYLPCHFFGEDFLAFGKVLNGKNEVVPKTANMHAAILIFPGVEELDFVGIYEVLTKARRMQAEGELDIDAPPEVLLLAREQRVVCANGLVVLPHRRYAGFEGYDLLIIPGGKGIKTLCDEPLLTDLNRFQERGKLLCSVCTGAMVLAWAGVLGGRQVTTHHASREQLSNYCRVVEQRVVADGNIMTAGGVSASLDLGLAVLERLYEKDVARKVADRIEYPWQ